MLEVVARANYIGHRRVGRAVARFQQRRPRRDGVDRAEPRRDRLGHGPDGRAELDLGRRERRARLRDVERGGFAVGAARGQRPAHGAVREGGLRCTGGIDALVRRSKHRAVEFVEARYPDGDDSVLFQRLPDVAHHRAVGVFLMQLRPRDFCWIKVGRGCRPPTAANRRRLQRRCKEDEMTALAHHCECFLMHSIRFGVVCLAKLPPGVLFLPGTSLLLVCRPTLKFRKD